MLILSVSSNEKVNLIKAINVKNYSYNDISKYKFIVMKEFYFFFSFLYDITTPECLSKKQPLSALKSNNHFMCRHVYMNIHCRISFFVFFLLCRKTLMLLSFMYFSDFRQFFGFPFLSLVYF